MKKIRMFQILKGNFLVLDVPICITILKIIYFYYLDLPDVYKYTYMINMRTFSEGICLDRK